MIRARRIFQSVPEARASGRCCPTLLDCLGRLSRRPYGCQRLEQRRVVLLAQERDVVGADRGIEHLGLERSSELALLLRRDDFVAGRDHNRRGHVQRSEPGAGVKALHLSPRFGDIARGAARQLRQQPRRLLVLGNADSPKPPPPGLQRRGREHQSQGSHQPPVASGLGILPVLGGGAQYEPADDIGMVAADELGYGTAHGVADHNGGGGVQLAQRGGRVGRAVGQPEALEWPHPAAMTAMIDRQHPIARGAKFLVCPPPVHVRAHDPAMEQHHHRAIAAGVAQEQLPAPRHRHRPRRRQVGRRLGRPGCCLHLGHPSRGFLPSLVMAVVIASDIDKDIAGEPLLRGISFKLGRRDRLTLSGRNGAGKTTLLRILAGEASFDGGERVLAKGTRVALHDQRPPRERELSLRDYVLTGARDLVAIEQELESLEQAMAGGAHDEGTMRRYADAQARLEHAGGYAWRDRALHTLRGLGFRDQRDLDRSLQTFSGGELTRASLARALAGDPDLLLLDEPTNHLDVASLEWLEQTLQALDAAIVLVAHDRWFLEAVGTSVLEVEGGRGRFFKGPWHAWRKEKAARELALGRAVEHQQAEIERLERFVTRFRAGTRARQAQSRVKKLARMERISRDPRDGRSLGFSFAAPQRS